MRKLTGILLVFLLGIFIFTIPYEAKAQELPTNLHNDLEFKALIYEEGALSENFISDTGDVMIDPTTVKANEAVNIYIFKGASQNGSIGYYVADNDKYNLMLVYADSDLV